MKNTDGSWWGDRAAWWAACLAFALSGCGGGGGHGYTIGGTITGLTAAGLVLADGSDTVSPASGATSFTFAIALASGSSYAVTVKTQPSGETCQVSGGSGTVGAANVTSAQVRCVASTYSVGGTITGLQGSGLVLANGSDTVNPASGATSFTFPTPVASGMTYAVTVKTLPKSEVCQVTNGTGTVGVAAVTNVVVACSRAWTWVSGSNTGRASGVYGTKGTAAPGNVPGARFGAASWLDASGNLWLFGGNGFDSTGVGSELNDLWTFNPVTGEWTWVSGADALNSFGVYGTQGTAAAGNVPGARDGAVSWTDGSGNLWLFGGAGNAAVDIGGLNDLWRFDPATDEWTWVAGANTANAAGVYGTHGTAAPSNIPGARTGAVSSTDASGKVWLFGGYGFDSVGNLGYLNDLWTFNPVTGEWTWVSGADALNSFGVYGTQGTAAAGNVPGARDGAVSWTDGSGNLWLFGGYGYDSVGNVGNMNDLWTFNPGTLAWAWVSGGNTVDAQVSNVPQVRASALSWTDGSGNLWLFGGSIINVAQNTVDYYDDLWTFTPATGAWTRVGSATEAGVYGTKGTPATGNWPGARVAAVSWSDRSGHLWLFGGWGFAAGGYLNDLWVY